MWALIRENKLSSEIHCTAQLVSPRLGTVSFSLPYLVIPSISLLATIIGTFNFLFLPP